MDQTREWLRRAKEGDKAAKEKLVTENTGLVWNVIRGFHGRGYDIEDLFQIGCIGLIKSIDRFDLSYDVKFSTYAVPLISGEIKRFFRDDGMIKVSRKWKEEGYKLYQVSGRLSHELGREPTIEELSCACELPIEEIMLALEANAEVDSLNKAIQMEGKEVTLMERIPSDADMEEEVVTHLALRQAMEELTDREKQIIFMRYFQNKTQTEIAKELGVSQVQISRLEKKVLKKMRSNLE